MDGVSQLTLIGWEFQEVDNWTNEAEDKDSQDTSSLVLKIMFFRSPFNLGFLVPINDHIPDIVLTRAALFWCGKARVLQEREDLKSTNRSS